MRDRGERESKSESDGTDRRRNIDGRSKKREREKKNEREVRQVEQRESDEARGGVRRKDSQSPDQTHRSRSPPQPD